ncbi:MAG: response regulator [Saprospiraceae bacterium]|nr:response regulator [Saprospiraceae bacterium]
MKYKCYILDDEPLALNVIEQHLSRFGDFEVCGKSTEPLEALAQIKRLQPDLLFLDIQMPELTGLELIESIQHRPAIVLTTAYREFAVEGFELNVLDYLVKPIPFKRFVQAIDKFLEQRLGQPPATVPVVAEQQTPDAIFVKADRKTLRILLDDILFVEGVKDYVKIVLPTQRILTKVSIGNFLHELPAGRFVQVHKSFIVAKAKVTAYTAQDIEIGEMVVPIGRLYKEGFLREMGQL